VCRVFGAGSDGKETGWLEILEWLETPDMHCDLDHWEVDGIRDTA
jgi:hypothetical protein